MLQEVIDLQNNSVVNLLYHTGKKDEVTFKAPTGSGKTHMMADFMDRTIADDEDVIFIVSSLSKGIFAVKAKTTGLKWQSSIVRM